MLNKNTDFRLIVQVCLGIFMYFCSTTSIYTNLINFNIAMRFIYSILFVLSCALMPLITACGGSEPQEDSPQEELQNSPEPETKSKEEDNTQEDFEIADTSAADQAFARTTQRDEDDNFQPRPLERKTAKAAPDKKEETPRQTVEKTDKAYDEVGELIGGLAVVKRDGKFGYIDAKGHEVVAPKYDFAEDFGEAYGLARVRIKDQVGYLNKQGQEVIPLKYRYIEKFVKGLAHARMLDGETFYINQKGERVGEVLDQYYEGMARIKKGDKIGYVNEQGQLAVPALYSYGTHFSGGKAEVKQDDKHFFINKSGECVQDCP